MTEPEDQMIQEVLGDEDPMDSDQSLVIPPPTIGVSPGVRQRHSNDIIKRCKSLRDTLDRIERGCDEFHLQSEVFNAQLSKHLSEDASDLAYLIGVANGALCLPDLVNGEAV